MIRPIAKCGCLAACVCGAGLGLAELHEFERPSPLLCSQVPAVGDLGAPERCSGHSNPHSRQVFMNAITVSSSVSPSLLVSSPVVFTVADAEDAAEGVDRRFAFSSRPVSDASAGTIGDRAPLFLADGVTIKRIR